MKTRLLCLSLCLTTATIGLGCDSPDEDIDSGAEQGETADTADSTEGTEGTEGTDESLDSDEDGLTDLEEAELGTDPNDADTDDDTYWDSWEVIEGTDPLDPNSRIYTGYWPYNPNKDALPQGSVGTSTTDEGSPFPREVFLDNYGDPVDIYDFTEYVNGNDELAYMIVDMSAMWCGPCHNMADWISGVDNQDTAGLQQSYPSVREKVHTHRIWWLTFVVQNISGGPATLADAQSWAAQHPDDQIPVFADQQDVVLPIYNGGSFPFFFLLNPYMGVEHWSIPGPNDNTFLSLFYVDQYL